ncbi:MAG: hypothetical protein KA885_08575 [Spirochaetes bacterium]|nr:hypothetical protein [Spirochaetota bacterium]
MYKKILIIFLFVMILICCNCSNEVDPDYLPSFDSIEVDENTIFLSNIKDDKKHIIYAVDTSNDKILYKYEFKNLIIYDMVYDASFDMNPYIVLLNGKAIKLNTKTGKCEKFELDFTPEEITIIDNDLWITPTGAGFEESPKKYFVYRADNNEEKYITLPEGRFDGVWTHINGKYYFHLFMDTINSKIYNYNDNKIIGNNLFEKSYVFYKLQNNYLQGYLSNPDYFETYYITSFEPLDGRFLFSSDKLLMINAFESDNFAYFLEIWGFSELYITMRDKNEEYKQIKQIFLNDSGNRITYCKNGYIWCVSEDNDGAYKVNMDDLSFEVIN